MIKKGILLVNLGSPDSTEVPDVKKYLRQFLMDEKVLDAPFPIRWFVVNCMILPKRPAASAEAYKQIWTDEGSPLITISRTVQQSLQEVVGADCLVELAMRYQNPSIEHAVERLRDQGIEDLAVVPLFPHYAMSSFESAAERVKVVLKQIAPKIEYRIVPPFYDHPEYIDALAEVTTPYLKEDFDHLLFSFHGIPERHLKVSDTTGGHCLTCQDCCRTESKAHETCYRAQCLKTVDALVAKTGLSEEQYSVAYQSRLGREPWLQPYTDHVIAGLPEQGVKKLLVICPAFVSDCLETLEEIGMRGKEDFLAAGGERLTLIPCLNSHERWIKALEELTKG